MFLGQGQPNRRTPKEITSAILAIAGSFDDNTKRRGVAKLKIMADAFLSFRIATDYLDKLEHNGLIEYNADTHYRITEKGKKLRDAAQHNVM